ncbi:transposase [Candidatus Saccharibacteria bacterium]|nr:MAG: transposase [Candidatus Saccharibacteria bacterium]
MGLRASRRQNGSKYENFDGRLDILAYCLMPNHFHFFIYQYDEKAMYEFFKRITVSYSMYFNERYKRVGPVFQQRYRASLIYSDEYFLHISRYIHLNPREWAS